mmetsp:Transcript_23031/g.38539  ORF Transcript_23031/g.38539 Transcript_23031/m.38539 type:complete len:469 (+) Transcript_23031:201-1607(+)
MSFFSRMVKGDSSAPDGDAEAPPVKKNQGKGNLGTQEALASLQMKVKEARALAAVKKAKSLAGKSKEAGQPEQEQNAFYEWMNRGNSPGRSYLTIAVGIFIIFFMALGDPMETMLHKKLAVSEKQKEELLGAQHELFQVRKEMAGMQKTLNETDRQLKESQKRLDKAAQSPDAVAAAAELSAPSVVTQDGDADEPNTQADAEAEVELIEAEALLLKPELGIPTFEDLQAVDWAWVRAEASETKVLIVVRQWVLDVTDFKSRHPGGDVFENGNDNTQAYFQEHGCSEEMLATLSTLVVARLANEGPAPQEVEEQMEEAETKIEELTEKIEDLTKQDDATEPFSLKPEPGDTSAGAKPFTAQSGAGEGEGVDAAGAEDASEVVDAAAEGEDATEPAEDATEADFEDEMKCIDNIISRETKAPLLYQRSWIFGVIVVFFVSAIVMGVQLWLPSDTSKGSHLAAKKGHQLQA